MINTKLYRYIIEKITMLLLIFNKNVLFSLKKNENLIQYKVVQNVLWIFWK